MRVAKGLGVLLAACLLFVIVAINFGTVESRLVCSGQVQRQVPTYERAGMAHSQPGGIVVMTGLVDLRQPQGALPAVGT